MADRAPLTIAAGNVRQLQSGEPLVNGIGEVFATENYVGGAIAAAGLGGGGGSEPVSNGNPAAPEIVFDDLTGDVVMSA